MLKNALRPTSDTVVWVIAAIAAITVYRVVMLAFSTADLFVDEAQYWLWGQELDWGYYSKPPMIGWVIRAVNELAGSDAPFWIRLPGPLLHAVTALCLVGAARRLTDPVSAAMCGLIYVTMPSVALGSFLISTDTVLLPFFAGAVWLYLILAERASARHAIAMGLCVGFGVMSKYAGIYFVICAALGALAVPQARIAWRDTALAALAALIVVSPNILWNLQNDLMTVSHTADNVDWVRQSSPLAGLNLEGAWEFFLGQFAVFGPVVFGAYLVIALRRGQGDWHKPWLVWMSAPILGLVIVQALLSKAFANWAVTAAVGVVLLTVPVLWNRARWVFWVGLAVNMLICLALPVATTQATTWTRNDGQELVLRRFTGRTETGRQILAAAQAEGLNDIVASHRHILADLFHTSKGSGVTIFAEPPVGRPEHYYAQKHAYPGGRDGSFAYVTTGEVALPCAPYTQPFAEWIAGPGAFRKNLVRLYALPTDCWSGGS